MGDIKVAIVHYHLERGGVTRIIEVGCSEFEKQGIDALVISGKPYEGSLPLKTAVIPELYYAHANEQTNASTLADSIERAAKQHFGQAPDIFHFHNHSLGKNGALPDAINILANKGYPLLLQIHDFAEDSRPGNYQFLIKNLSHRRALYPVSPRIHYATVNQRDLRFLANAGIPPNNLHHLPNPITKITDSGGEPSPLLRGKKVSLYVTRGIRRKNIGELLLWASLEENDNALFATTLSPTNPKEKAIHDMWNNLAEELGLPAQLGITDDPERLSFAEAIQSADRFITTSVTEGFGLGFLEPLLIHKSLTGRNLKEITDDFSEHGISLSNLYNRLDVSKELLPKDALENTLRVALDKFYREYQVPMPANALEKALGSLTNGDYIDFGGLDERLQEIVIRNARGSKEARDALNGLNQLQELDREKLQQFGALVSSEYCPKLFASKAFSIYKKTTEGQGQSNTPDSIDPQRVLEQFIKPERFSLLRN